MCLLRWCGCLATCHATSHCVIMQESDKPDVPWRVLAFRTYVKAKGQSEDEIMLTEQSHRVCALLQHEMTLVPFELSLVKVVEFKSHSFCHG